MTTQAHRLAQEIGQHASDATRDLQAVIAKSQELIALTNQAPGPEPEPPADGYVFPERDPLFEIPSNEMPDVTNRIWNDSDLNMPNSNCVIRDRVFENSQYGFDVMGNVSGTIYLVNCTFRNNYQDIAFRSINGRIPRANLVCIGCIFEDIEVAPREQGIYFRGPGKLLIDGCTFKGKPPYRSNQLHAIYTWQASRIEVRNSSFDGMSAAGGKLFGDHIIVDDCTFNDCAYGFVAGASADLDWPSTLVDNPTATARLDVRESLFRNMHDIEDEESEIGLKIQAASGRITNCIFREDSSTGDRTTAIQIIGKKLPGRVPVVEIDGCIVHPDRIPNFIHVESDFRNPNFTPKVRVTNHTGQTNLKKNNDGSLAGVEIL